MHGWLKWLLYVGFCFLFSIKPCSFSVWWWRIADDRQVARVRLGLFWSCPRCWTHCFAGVHVCQQSRCPQESLTRGCREEMMIPSRGGNPIVLRKGELKECLLFISRLLALQSGDSVSTRTHIKGRIFDQKFNFLQVLWDFLFCDSICVSVCLSVCSSAYQPLWFVTP